MTMKKYCCIILTLALVLAGCSTTKPADSVSSTYETTETNLESTSSNESTNPSAREETSNANCYTIEEVAMVRQMVQWMSTELKCSRKRQRKKLRML